MHTITGCALLTKKGELSEPHSCKLLRQLDYLPMESKLAFSASAGETWPSLSSNRRLL